MYIIYVHIVNVLLSDVIEPQGQGQQFLPVLMHRQCVHGQKHNLLDQCHAPIQNPLWPGAKLEGGCQWELVAVGHSQQVHQPIRGNIERSACQPVHGGDSNVTDVGSELGKCVDQPINGIHERPCNVLKQRPMPSTKREDGRMLEVTHTVTHVSKEHTLGRLREGGGVRERDPWRRWRGVMLGDGCIQLSLAKSLCRVGMSGWNTTVEICVEAMVCGLQFMRPSVLPTLSS